MTGVRTGLQRLLGCQMQGMSARQHGPAAAAAAAAGAVTAQLQFLQEPQQQQQQQQQPLWLQQGCLPHLQQQRCGLHTSLPSCASKKGDGAPPRRTPARDRHTAHLQRLHSYKARIPKAQKYGPALRESDPAAFEAMRLVVGYYDLPQNRHKPRPPPPSHVTLNMLQTLRYTADVDPYYKLALLSYRSKLANTQLAQVVAGTRALLGRLSAPPDVVPGHLEQLKAAATAQATTQPAPDAQPLGAASAAGAADGGGGEVPRDGAPSS